LLILAFSLAVCAKGQNVRQILASGYSSGFYPLTFNEDTGSIDAGLAPVPGSESDASMSFATYDERTGNLYAIVEGGGPEEDVMIRWIPAPDLSSISREQAVSVKGYGPAHVALNTEYNVIFISNYGSGSVAVYSIDPSSGVIGDEPLYAEAYESGSGVVPDRQEAAHAHGAFFFKDNAYVCDLGGDKIWHYKIGYAPDGGSIVIEKDDDYATFPGFGPRHMAVDEARNRVYVINELEQYVTVLDIDTETGTLFVPPTLSNEIPYTVEGAPDNDAQTGAEIALAGDGKTLYVSHRNFDGLGAMVVFSVEDGVPYLTQIQDTSTSGSNPRFFAVVGQNILVTDQFDNFIDVFRADPEDLGRLSLVSSTVGGQQPTCLTVVA